MFTLPDLPYDYKALEPYIDEETMKIHHDMHHNAYVKNTNDALAQNLELLVMDPIELYLSLDKVPEQARTKVKNNLGGHINHTFFWGIMCANSNFHLPVSNGELMKNIESTFGSFEIFQEKFSEVGLGRFGSGWVWLVVDNGKLDIVSTANQDNPILESKTPILGLDVWEHAYYLKYKNVRVDYISAFWNIVNWGKVAENYEVGMKLKEGGKS